MAEIVTVTVEPIEEPVTVTVAPVDETVTVTVSPIDETVTVIVTEGALPVNIDINGNEYLVEAEGDVDIPVINSAATPVGTIDGENVEVGDSVVTIELDGTPVDTVNVPAEGAATVEVTDYLSKITISLTYDQLTQTIWQDVADAQGNGAMANGSPVPSVTFPAAIINYSSADLPAGINLNASTGVYSKGTYASIPSGANTFNIDWEVDASDPNYTGSGSVEITVTKEVRWLPTSGGAFETATLRTDFALDMTDEGGQVTEVAGEVSAVLSSNGTTSFSQGTASIRPQLAKLCDGRYVVNTQGDSTLSASFTNDIPNDFTLWYFGTIDSMTNSSTGHLFHSTANAANYRLWWSGGTNSFFRITVNAILVTFASLTKTQRAAIRHKGFVTRIRYKNGDHLNEIYTESGLIYTSSDNTVNAANFLANGFNIELFGTTNRMGGKVAGMYVCTGAHSSNDVTNMYMHGQYQLGLISQPPFV